MAEKDVMLRSMSIFILCYMALDLVTVFFVELNYALVFIGVASFFVPEFLTIVYFTHRAKRFLSKVERKRLAYLSCLIRAAYGFLLAISLDSLVSITFSLSIVAYGFGFILGIWIYAQIEYVIYTLFEKGLRKFHKREDGVCNG